MTSQRPALALVLLTCACPHAVLALPPEQVAGLQALDDRLVARLDVRQASWIGKTPDLIAGGWDGTSGAVVLLSVGPVGAVRPISDAASPFFETSAYSNSLAYWRAGDDPGTCVLAIMPWGRHGELRTIGLPRPRSPAPRLAWPADRQLFMGVSDANGARLVLVDHETGTERDFGLIPGADWIAFASPLGRLVARWQRRGSSEEGYVAADAVGTTLLSIEREEFLSHVTPAAARRLGITTGPVATWSGLRTASHGPSIRDSSGLVVFHAEGARLFVTSGDGAVRRELAVNSGEQTIIGIAAAPDGSAVAYWTAGKPGGESTGELHLALLGTEQITARARFPAGSAPKVGERLWVALGMRVDALSAKTEPEWRTVKGCFEVTKVTPEASGTLVEGRNLGTEAHLLTRLTGGEGPGPETKVARMTVTLPGGRAAPWLESYTKAALPGLMAWLQDTQAVGTLTEVVVERRLSLGSEGRR